MINSTSKPEILAPCGSYDILVAAVSAGADACYIGGNQFGARAYAENLASDSIVKAIDYAHLHGTKLYLTVNTLIKQSELRTLYDFLLPFYTAGLDAVIVQDLGAFRVIRELFSDLHIHCSTQMNVNSVHAASFMKEQGAVRIVTAREMSLDEIRTIKERVDIEVESFVHGAMCFSYSGQCLMSSMAGGRSGNRGRCAQPCRKCYDGAYSLSMKDMCTLSLIPELVSAGIDSLKIEGRMKNEYYVASAVDAYRQIRDDYIQGCYDGKKAEALFDRLANIYNRGGFCGGYYHMSGGPEMISAKRPNNQGVVVGQLEEVSPGKLHIRTKRALYKGDVLEIKLKDGTTLDITTGVSCKAGEAVALNAPKTRQVREKQNVLRTRCSAILEDVRTNILEAQNQDAKIRLSGSFFAEVGQPLTLALSCRISGRSYSASALGCVVEKSEKQAADTEKIRTKLSQLGGTDYIFEDLSLVVARDAFVPMGAVKQLRRDAIAKLSDMAAESYRRTPVANEYPYDETVFGGHIDEDAYEQYRIKVGVTGIEQLRAVMKYSSAHGGCDIYGIYMSRSLYDRALREGLIKKAVEAGIKIYMELPYIINNDFDINQYLPNEGISGIYIRNIDGFAAAAGFRPIKDMEWVCGFSLYAYNNAARQFLLGEHKNIVFEMPRELNFREYGSFSGGRQEYTVYGYQQVMLTAQCLKKNREACSHANETVRLADDRGNIFFARCICEECCNVIYNGLPFGVPKERKLLRTMFPSVYYKLEFTLEDGKETEKVMEYYRDYFQGKDTSEIQKGDMIFTAGHSYRGVE